MHLRLEAGGHLHAGAAAAMNTLTPVPEQTNPPADDLSRRRTRGVSAYQNFPVFSKDWLRGRTTLAAVLVGLLGALALTWVWLATASPLGATVVATSWVVSGLLMATLGPALATLARQRRWVRQREQQAVVVSILAGIVASYFIDNYASSLVEAHLQLPTPPASAPIPGLQAAQLLLSVAVYGLLGGALALRQYFREPELLAALARERELAIALTRHRDLDAHLAVLQAQIEPHFLFNTLASVRSLIATDPDAATGTIDALVEYLRATIPRIRNQNADSTLGQQLEICASYLKVMAVRLGRLSYELNAQPKLRALPFPPLLLVSLVENALKHGIHPKRGAGRVSIQASMHQAKLVVSVTDDGVGLSETPGSGVGLNNVRAQLQARYGAGAQFLLTSNSAAGTSATITIDEPTAIQTLATSERESR